MAFDKPGFARLLEAAKGKQSINSYGKETGVDPGYISRLLRGLVDTPPSAAVITRLASKANNEISTEQLLEKAGYLAESRRPIADPLDDPELSIMYNDLRNAPPDVREETRRFLAFLLEKEKERKPGDRQGG
jgi:transcriptional regulator with XRE-family HTH domain